MKQGNVNRVSIDFFALLCSAVFLVKAKVVLVEVRPIGRESYLSYENKSRLKVMEHSCLVMR